MDTFSLGTERAAGTAGRAIVIGAGFAGMTAAAVLAAHFPDVVLIEQDCIAPHPEPRKSLPQATHAHALLQSGRDVLLRLFPGFEQRALAAGSLRLQVRSQWRTCLRGRWVAPEDTGLVVLSQTRGLLDHLIRSELAALPAIRHLSAKVDGLIMDEFRQVCGVRLQADDGGATSTLGAALVVDASGRAGASDRWLTALGVAAPRCETAYPEVRYVSAEFTRSVTDGPDLAGWLNTASAPQIFGGVLAPVENQRWIATATTRFGDPAPEDDVGFHQFLENLQDNRLGPILRHETRLTPFSRYRIAATRLKRYDLSAQDLPPGYLPIGDVIASFNPVYGQGLSVAALQVDALAQALRGNGWAAGWQRSLRDDYLPLALRPAQWAWHLGLANDTDFPQFTATPNHEAEYLRRALQRAFIVSTRNPDVRSALDRTLHLIDPPDAVFDLPVIAEALAPKPVLRPAVAPHEGVL